MTNMEESKFYFLGTAPKEKRISFLKSYISSLKGQLNKLTAIKESGNCMKDEVLLANLERVSGEKEITGNLSVVSEEKDIRSILENTVKRHGGNRSAAGRELGISPRMMNYRMNRAGVEV